MIKFGKWIAKHKVIIVIISMLLLIPSFLGMAATRVNYDILSYLPESLETVEGQDIMVDEFGMGAFSMVVVEDMELKDVAALKEKTCPYLPYFVHSTSLLFDFLSVDSLFQEQKEMGIY